MDREPFAECPDENTLLSLLSGSLRNTSQLAALEGHIASCATCGGLLAELGLTEPAPTALSVAVAAGAQTDELATLERVAPERFQVVREIARGGMGRLIEAWDRRHARPVAIKLLIHTNSVGARARFVREARITARLQHPGIIPLYEAGRWSRDEPFLVMKLVAGAPLDEIVHARARLDERLLLLPHVVAMTEALAYAHEQGVIHRDLKPANVLVGAFGETVVIDWGLAKVLGEADSLDAARDGGSSDDRALTQAGSAIGTPAYMAPEQARGEPVDARADVYALGALLYHVLSGEMPYHGLSARETLDRVLVGPPRPLAARAPDVPRDLATIVAKAMARDPAERYPDARAMAGDLRLFVNGQLVSAHAYSLGALLRRWVVRHRAVVGTASVLLLVLTVFSTLSVRRVVRERDRADAQKALADHERGKAMVQRDAAERLVGFVVGRLRDRLEALGKLALLAGVGSEVSDYYGTLGVASDATDVGPLRRRGMAILTLADVDTKKRSYETATALTRSAIAVFDAAHARDPADIESDALRVAARGTLVSVLTQAGQGDEALAEATRATDAAAEALRGNPGDPRPWLAAAFAESRLGTSRVEHAEVEAARGCAARARTDIDHAGDVGALDAFWQDLLGATYRNLGGVATRAQDWAGVVEVTRAGIAHRRRQLASEPDHVEHLSALAYLLRGQAFAEEKLGKAEPALADLHESIRIRARVLDLEPEDTTAEYDQGIALSIACDFERAWHGPSAAKADCLSAASMTERVVAKRPDDGKAEDAMARALRAVGRMHLAAHRPAAALRAFDQALDEARRAAARDSSSFPLASTLTQSLDAKTKGELALGHIDAAREVALETVALERKLHDAHPAVSFFDTDLGARLATLGDVEWARGDAPAAREAYREALDHLERAAASDPGDLEATVALATTCLHAAAATTDGAERTRLSDRARRFVEPLEDAGRLSPEALGELRFR